MPSFVLNLGRPVDAARPQSLDRDSPAGAAVAVPEIAGRNCQLQGYERVEVPEFKVAGPIIAYASPDSTFAVTKKLLDAARRSILIGIYDFSAPHMQELLEAALARGVKVTLMLDIDSKKESDLFDRLTEMGVRGVSAPSCANDTVRVFRSSHEKVIIIDGEWSLVQSGNYSSNSIPLNEVDGGGPGFRTGNRDMGLAVKSRKLARFLTDLLERDMALAEGTPEMLRRPVEDNFFLIERAPKGPKKTFRSELFDLESDVSIRPVLSPDNYMDVIPELLSAARRSIEIEQQYIRANQPNIRRLLAAIKDARTNAPGLKVRIVLGKIFDKRKLEAEKRNLKALADDFGLKLGTHIRYINTDQFVHCHNKMILIDGEGVLISSQNWSDAAVTENREAGVWLRHRGIAGYFRQIFEHDWKDAVKTLPEDEAAPEVLMPRDLQAGGFIRVERADYEEV